MMICDAHKVQNMWKLRRPNNHLISKELEILDEVESALDNLP